ncbi:odorant receptor 94b [Stomoxys calcitrans]|uniref:odorant receptor 94b n=1 Tax=Stomoxys calcitrans TaxID=35570 RepID=UPI0027E2B953|nr:odorant receptor 94b [Stomoxys calcitrans]
MSRIPIEKFRIQQYKKIDRVSSGRLLILILKVLGLWHWQEEEDQSVLSIILHHLHAWLLHVPMSFAFCALMWIEVFRAPDFVEAGKVLYMSLTLSVVIPKTLSFWLLSTRICRFIKDLQVNPMYEFQSQEEILMWHSQHKLFKNVVRLYLGGSVLAALGAFIGVLFEEDYQLGFPYWVPFEWHNPRGYWLAYLYNVVAMSVACFSNVSFDMFGCYMIFHIGLLYKLLSLRFHQLQHVDEVKAKDKLMAFVLMHMKIKRATKECEHLVSHYVLNQIIFSALIICFSGYRLQKMNIMDNVGQFFSMLQFLSIMILEIFLPCYFANEITVNSSLLLFDIYKSNWLNYSPSTRKFIILFMEFLKQPVIIKAGGYFEIGLPIFTKVMNNAYTFFALLLNVDEK